ncbi:MAG TPA: leukotriene A4 hydrolase C-terminal domain-containing protein, partial [Saprospiraceae bacterium]|nr:leukotriene A4 hydrolase C-terminal domain-containing protein [Saprospiraceae bacterium]
DIAYEKGAHFLLLLEQTAGREKFDAFLKKYFDDNKFKSMTTQGFVDYLDKELLKPNNLTVNVDEWVYGPGLPSNIPVTVSERFVKVDEQVKSFLGGAAASTLPVKEWSTHEWLHFLLALPDTLPTARMKDLDKTFNLTNSHNSEIQEAWYKLAINQGYGKEIVPAIRSFLVNAGRRKFLTPLYTAMIDKGMKAEAESIYKEARPNYHSVSYNTIDKLFAK